MSALFDLDRDLSPPERAAASTTKKPAVWLESCRHCGKKHKWTLGPCPECAVHTVPVLVSENACWHDQDCDGCQAYRDHQR